MPQDNIIYLFYGVTHMKFIILFILKSAMIFAAEEENNLTLPISFKPFLETIRWAFERDEDGHSTKTLKDIKERVDPLKEAFYQLVEDPKVFTYYERLEDSINRYYNIYEERYIFLDQPLTREEEARFQEQFQDVAPLMDRVPDLSKCNSQEEKTEKLITNQQAIKDALTAYGALLTYDPNPTLEKTTMRQLRTLFDCLTSSYSSIRKRGYVSARLYSAAIGYTFKCISPYLLDEYLPPICKKTIFPFYMIQVFNTLIAASKLHFDYEVERYHYFAEDGTLKRDRVIDVSDKLDAPFFESYEIIIEKCSVFKHCPIDILMDNFCYVYDNFVKFAPFFDFELKEGEKPFETPLKFEEITFKPKMSSYLFAK
ncbi:MAG: hypothetical protein FADNKDHG_01586 [Holosporales bacterium]